MKNGFSKLEKSWILYDVGNSAFTLLVTTIVPIYFNYLAGNAGISSVDYLAYWGYAASICTIIIAIIGPIFGTIADNKGYKRPLFTLFLVIGLVGCLSLGLSSHWLVFLVIFIIAKVGYSSSLIFYDAMLPDVTTPEKMDNVSSQGFAWGYIGSCIPFILCLVVVLGNEAIGITMTQAMMIAFVIIAAWWLLMTIPLLKQYKQIHYVEHSKHAVRQSFTRLKETFMNISKEKKLLLFMIAYFFYIDGVYTIIDMATAYGTALGLDTTGLLLALLLTQVVAFPFAILFGKLSSKYPTEKLIMTCISAYTGIAIFAMLMTTQLHFWILAVAVGMFQGGVQALSRSHFAKLIPSEKSGEYFGLLDICGKGASFMGTALVGITTQISGSTSIGVGILVVVFVIGLIVFTISIKAGTKIEG